MMQNRLLIAIWALLSFSFAFGQEVQFSSRPFELGLRHHLGVDTLFALTPEQLDTITQLDLSQLEITDISDVCNVSNVRRLNLRYNAITDVSPLALLDSLESVDLSNNRLQSINALAFASSKAMMVDVSFNNIMDFSCFNSLTRCRFTMAGTMLQTDPNAAYFHVGPLYCDGSLETPVVYYRVSSNMPQTARLQCRDKDIVVPTDGSYLTLSMDGGQTASSRVLVSNGVEADSTYLVTYAPQQLSASEVLTIETGLPADYSLKYVSQTLQGSLSIDGNDLVYTASTDFVGEEIFFTYYQGSTLRGFSKVILANATGIRELETVDGKLTVVRQRDSNYRVTCRATGLAPQSVLSVYDPSGRLIASKQVDSNSGIDTTLSLPVSRYPILIFEVVSGRKKWIEKIVAN